MVVFQTLHSKGLKNRKYSGISDHCSFSNTTNLKLLSRVHTLMKVAYKYLIISKTLNTFFGILNLIYITKYFLAVVGFEPTPPKRLVPKTSALDHSATLPYKLHAIALEIVFNWTLWLQNQL